MFRALGPFEVSHEGVSCALPPKQRALLAILLCAEGKQVSKSRLVDQLWNGKRYEEDSANALNTLFCRLRSQLRAIKAPVSVERAAGTCWLRIDDPESVDLLRFRHLRREARKALDEGERERAIQLLREAESLCVGEPLAGFSDDWAIEIRTRLTEDVREARYERIRLEFESGRHVALIGELSEMVAQKDVDESVVSLLVRALHRSGRSGDALEAYDTACRRLRKELDCEPGPELRHLRKQIADRDPALLLAEPPDDPRQPAAAPCTLRHTIRDFTGRRAELRMLLTDQDADGTALPVTVVHGMGGVGKSTLVRHVAHQLRGRYPDGQFLVELHAHSGQPPSDPADLLAALLQDARVTFSRPPTTLDGWAAQWRRWTAHKRVLLILDDVRDAAQIRPFLPGSPSCRVLVASRYRLTELESYREIALDVLATTAAVDLFTGVAGKSRVTDTSAVRAVVDRCGHHPLAIRLVANNFRHRHTWSVHDVADRLTRESGSLEGFPLSVATAFQFSYSGLTNRAQRLFRYLALHPGPDITLLAASALVRADRTELDLAIAELQNCHLLEELARDRFFFHDLIRSFARDMGRQVDAEEDRKHAVQRLISHYLVCADEAARVAFPYRRRIEVDTLRFPGDAVRFANDDEALAWLTIEKQNLIAVAHLAVDESPDHAKLFPHVLVDAFPLWPAWESTVELRAAALRLSREQGDRSTLAAVLVEHAEALGQRDYGEARRAAEEALSLFQAIGDRRGAADALMQVARATLAAGRREEVLVPLGDVLAYYRLTGNRYGEAEALNLMAVARGHRGEYEATKELFRAALEINRELGNLRGESKAQCNLGENCFQQGRYAQARSHFEEAMRLAEQAGARREVGIIHQNIGNVWCALGRPELAISCYQKSLGYCRSLGNPYDEANVLVNLAGACADLGRPAEAALHFRAAEQMARDVGALYELQNTLIRAAEFQLSSRQYGTALESYQRAMRIAEEIDSPLGLVRSLHGLAQTLDHTDRTDMARKYRERAEAIGGERLEGMERGAWTRPDKTRTPS